MTHGNGVSALISRLQEARGADRNLDAAIAKYLCVPEQPFTSSAEAAKSLAPRKTFEEIWHGPGEKMSSAQLIYRAGTGHGRAPRTPSIYAVAATEPLAICIASLIAHEKGER